MNEQKNEVKHPLFVSSQTLDLPLHGRDSGAIAQKALAQVGQFQCFQDSRGNTSSPTRMKERLSLAPRLLLPSTSRLSPPLLRVLCHCLAQRVASLADVPALTSVSLVPCQPLSVGIIFGLRCWLVDVVG